MEWQSSSVILIRKLGAQSIREGLIRLNGNWDWEHELGCENWRRQLVCSRAGVEF